MVKKRAINEQDKKNFAKGKKFSKDYQPSPEAKSLGKKKRKTMREMLDYLLEKEITNKAGEKASTQEAITVALIAQALKGNIRAWELIRDTIGEKPSDKIETTQTTINIQDKKVIDKVMKNLKEL